MTREFDFLPQLPKPNLDDRSFKDLVDECLLRIPRYCPEWTNYNPSDPGVTMIELFAWLTDEMLRRFNQVPVVNYITFLELLGMRLQAPRPATCEVTFYLSRSPDTTPIPISSGTEVATERTETDEALIFATDQDLNVTKPRIQYILSAPSLSAPHEKRLAENLTLQLQPNPEDPDELTVQGNEGIYLFTNPPQSGNCFYVVLNHEDNIQGHVIVFTIKSPSATPTGIDPQNPPREWTAWNGEKWETVLLVETDDATEGFSFSKFEHRGGSATETGATITLHLPLGLSKESFQTSDSTYYGYLIRCAYKEGSPQNRYSSPPRLNTISVKSIGGTVRVTQSTCISEEILGESDGNPGQTFQLQRTPILARNEQEYIRVRVPGRENSGENWAEVENFANSQKDDLHYTIDSITGKVQFGPLIREPSQIKASTLSRGQMQRGVVDAYNEGSDRNVEHLFHQYGKVPERGAEICMVKYRTGGGEIGNVPKAAIRVLKSATAYVDRIVNYKRASGGTDAESLQEVVFKVPNMLRTRDRAVTKEDFETLAIAAGKGAIARAYCHFNPKQDRIKLLLIPSINNSTTDFRGNSGENLALTTELKDEIQSYLDERRPLGLAIDCEQPEYVRVRVEASVVLEPNYIKNLSREKLKDIEKDLNVRLYQFLNPLTEAVKEKGWPFSGKGWPFERPVYEKDIVNFLINDPNIPVLSVWRVNLCTTFNQKEEIPWQKEIKLESTQMVTSWEDSDSLGHNITIRD